MAAETESHDATLARRAAGGCLMSFSELARRYQVPVVHYVRHLAGRGGADADDVAQEAFLRAWQHIGDYAPQWAFSTWLFTIARRTWLNQVRAARRRRVRERAVAAVEADGVEAVAVAIASERTIRLWRVARAELSEREFTALWMRYAEDKPVAEIAVVLDKPVATVKVILFRARRRLGPFVRDLAGWSG
jgi:RNA polymerase sigma factor (sigma-70 family)